MRKRRRAPRARCGRRPHPRTGGTCGSGASPASPASPARSFQECGPRGARAAFAGWKPALLGGGGGQTAVFLRGGLESAAPLFHHSPRGFNLDLLFVDNCERLRFVNNVSWDCSQFAIVHNSQLPAIEIVQAGCDQTLSERRNAKSAGKMAAVASNAAARRLCHKPPFSVHYFWTFCLRLTRKDKRHEDTARTWPCGEIEGF